MSAVDGGQLYDSTPRIGREDEREGHDD